MNWWCAATTEPWSWTPRAYPGVWAFVAALAVAGMVVARRSGVELTGRQRAFAWAGLLAVWISLDWPVGTLGGGYLASAHMAQYMLLTFVAGPLFVLSMPEALARRALSGHRVRRSFEVVTHPIFAALATNAVLVATHAPFTVDTVRTSQLGSFVLDLVWLVGGVLLWLPVCGPIRELIRSYPIRGVYLFVAAGVVPMIPGGFLTFADFPLYRLYELAPRVGSMDPLDDQQLAGAIMKIGSLPFVWTVIGAMFWRWAADDRRSSAPIPKVTRPMAEVTAEG